MKELVVISGKGGTGKTSLVASFAALANNAVHADCDVDAADLHLILSPEIKHQDTFIGGKIAHINQDLCTSCGRCREVCRYDAITPDYVVEEISCEGCGVCVWNCPESAITFEPRESGKWFISETRHGPMVHARLGIAEENSGKLVALVRKEAKELAKARGRDLILVDGPPGIGCPVISSVTGADFILIITEPTVSGLHDLQRVVKLTKHFQIPAAACVNKHDLNSEMAAKIAAYCDENDIPVVGNIPFDSQVTKAQMVGQSVVEYSNGKLSETIRTVWERVLQELK